MKYEEKPANFPRKRICINKNHCHASYCYFIMQNNTAILIKEFITDGFLLKTLCIDINIGQVTS